MKMLQYERIDISEVIDFNKTNKSVECMICHYWYFKDMFVLDVMIFQWLFRI